LDFRGVSVGIRDWKTVMDDLTAQEGELILALRLSRSFTLIVHKNEQWRIVLTDDRRLSDESRRGGGIRERLGQPQWQPLNRRYLWLR